MQTTRPHFLHREGVSQGERSWRREGMQTDLQWCFRTKKLNWVRQIGQNVTSESGCHLGNNISEKFLGGPLGRG